MRFITARHVIDGIRGKLVTEVYLRMNRVDGDAAWLKSNIADWFDPPDGSVY